MLGIMPIGEDDMSAESLKQSAINLEAMIARADRAERADRAVNCCGAPA